MYTEKAIAQLVFEILELAAIDQRSLQQAARKRAMSVNQLLAVAIAEAVRELLKELPQAKATVRRTCHRDARRSWPTTRFRRF
jgi:hypothetical protein